MNLIPYNYFLFFPETVFQHNTMKIKVQLCTALSALQFDICIQKEQTIFF